MSPLRPWFALKSVPGVGNRLFRRLLERFGSPEAALAAEASALLAVNGVSSRLAAAIRTHRTDAAIDHELTKINKNGFTIVTQTDPRFPPLLRQIPDPPPFLYVSGTLPVGDALSIAIVGSRNATAYGLSTTRELSMNLATTQVTIVSGLARGVDTAAHAGALAAGGTTVAVLGSGLDRIYPRENTDLARRIAEHGAVISEFPLGTGPDAHHFPARNRIISGLCHGTVVVEATGRSGSLITARLALEQNRDVYAVPGNVHSFKSVGTHSLIKQGAKLVTHAGDVLDEYTHLHSGRCRSTDAPRSSTVPLTDEEAMVIDNLDVDPIHIDDLARRMTVAVGRLSGLLLQLELKGLVCQSPGKQFGLTPEAVRLENAQGWAKE